MANLTSYHFTILTNLAFFSGLIGLEPSIYRRTLKSQNQYYGKS